MNVKTIVSAAAMMAAAIVPNATCAAASATALSDLNIRSGPGPDFPVIGFIAASGRTIIDGCLQDSWWCQVTHNGIRGWAYSQYLRTDMPTATIALAQQRAALGIPTIVYQAAPEETVGLANDDADSAVVAEAVSPTVLSPAPAIVPPELVRRYVITHRINPVYLNREVVVGAALPDAVNLLPVPDYRYAYTYVNRQPVLVDPGTRRVVYIYR